MGPIINRNVKKRVHTVNKLTKSSVVLAIILMMMAAPGFSQYTDNSGQWAGVTDIFDFPVGARALAMGGAFVSVVDDPYALYWNPAGLELAQRVGFGIYHTNLPASSSYNYFSFSYPTLSLGTFSAGILRIGTGGIDLVDPEASKYGETDYNRTLFMFGYGFRAKEWFYMGTNFKVERASLPGYEGTSNFTESALGADLGMMIRPQQEGGFLHNFSVGLNFQNFLQRSMRVVEVQDKTPRNFLFGMSKGFGADLADHHALLAFQMDINGAKDVPTFYHMGLEYDFRKMFYLRMGLDHRGEQAKGVSGTKMTFGGGVEIMGVKIDYSYWSPRYSVLTSSHRISLIYSVGKTRKQRLEELQQADLERIKMEVERQQRYVQREAYLSGLEQARINYKSGDYIRAFSAINRVLALDPTGNDPSFSEARQLLNEINGAIEKQREEELGRKVAKTREEADLRRQQQEIDEHYDKAMAYFETEDFREALSECDRALELDPESKRIKGLREIIVENIRKKIGNLVENARRLVRSGKHYDAIQYYNQALALAKGDNDLETAIQKALRALESRLNRDQTLQRANEYELKQDYERAAELYNEALKLDPNNTALKQKYDEMYARANARSKPLTGRAKEFYTRGMNEFNRGNYREALNYFEQASELDPLNLSLLKAIDVTRKRLSSQ